MSYDERTETKRLSRDGKRLIIITRWLDRQHATPRWRSKNRHVKLSAAEIEYYRQQAEDRDDLSQKIDLLSPS